MYTHKQYLLMCIFILMYLSSCNKYTDTTNSIPETPRVVMQPVQEGNIKLYFDLEMKDNPNASLDLETVTVLNSALGDIKFIVSRGGGGAYFYFLQPTNGAKANFVSKSAPELDGCLDMIPSLTIGNIPEIETGTYICAITTQGYLAQIQVQDMDISGISKGWIELAIITWRIP